MAGLAGSRVAGVAGVIVAGIAMLSSATSALAQANGPSQATALVLGAPLIEAQCPAGGPADTSGPATTSSLPGVATVTGAGAFCQDGAAPAASTSGIYTLAAEPTTAATPLRFSAGCQSSTLTSFGQVDVPVGTIVDPPGPTPPFVAGVGGNPTTVNTYNTPVIYPNGTTAILNQQTIVAGTSVTHSAIVLGNGTIIGRVICGAAGVYPLAVDVSGASEAASPLAAQAPSGGESGPGTSLVLFGAVAVMAIAMAQVAVARRMRRRGGITA